MHPKEHLLHMRRKNKEADGKEEVSIFYENVTMIDRSIKSHNQSSSNRAFLFFNS